jgi:hydroxymethylbilane synthase
MPAARTVVVGTRGSRLALAQTGWVVDRLRSLTPEAVAWETRVITTSGDRTTGPLTGDGAFVKEIQRALAAGEIDLAVHSLKDLPTDPVEGLVVAAVPERADPHDALVGRRLDALAPGARVGTGSPRRSAQLLHARPGTVVVPIRGNVPTRVEAARTGTLDAVVLAAAGLGRLGMAPDDLLPADVMLPAPGQGALALETRADDAHLRALLAAVHDEPSAAAVVAERALLRSLGGGCLLPVGALAVPQPDGTLVLTACATSADGAEQVRASGRGPLAGATALGEEVGAGLAAQGALELLGGDGG